MYYFTSADVLITLFGYLSSLDFNNRIENLNLMTKFWGPLFSGGGEAWGSASSLLPPSRAGPANNHSDLEFLHTNIWVVVVIYL